MAAGLKAGASGVNAANKARASTPTISRRRRRRSSTLFEEVAAAREARDRRRAEERQCASIWHAYALGRYAQGISVAKALAQGIGGKVKDALEQTIKLEPKHADAHIALGAYHAEVIDKVGAMVGGLTYGAKKETGVEHFQQGAQADAGFGDRAHRIRQRPGA